MKKFEYMTDLLEKFRQSGYKNIDQFLNKMGSEGWDIELHYQDTKPVYFAKREIDEPASQH